MQDKLTEKEKINKSQKQIQALYFLSRENKMKIPFSKQEI